MDRWPRFKPPQLKSPDFVFTKVTKIPTGGKAVPSACVWKIGYWQVEKRN